MVMRRMFRPTVSLLAVIGHREALAFVPAASLSLVGALTRGGCMAQGTTRVSCVRALSARFGDGVSETRRVGFVTSGTDGDGIAKETDEEVVEIKAELQTVNKRLLEQIEEQAKGIVIDSEESKKIIRREEDLNGVNPFYAALGAAMAGGMSFGSWKATTWSVQVYYSKPPVESDILAINRLTAFIKQAVVGLSALGAGIFGVTALGLGIMAGIVAVGVAKGELDPSPQAKTSRKIDPAASPKERAKSSLKDAREFIRKADEEIQREIGGKL